MHNELTLENIEKLFDKKFDEKLTTFKAELKAELIEEFRDIFVPREEMHEYFNAVGMRFNEVTRRFEHDEKLLNLYGTSIAKLDERVDLLETI